MGTSTAQVKCTVRLPAFGEHIRQQQMAECQAKRMIACVGRRGGKTVGIAHRAVKRFLAGRRVLYAVPTTEQLNRFWVTVLWSLSPAIDKKIFYKNETEHIIEFPGTEQRIKAKTAWNVDTLRGDYADDLILDEWQLMDEDAWRLVGLPMLADNDGSAAFLFTPPSLHSRSSSKARDPLHAIKMFRMAHADNTGDWRPFHWTSYDNPYLSRSGLERIKRDMTTSAHRQEILADWEAEISESAIWKAEWIENNRATKVPALMRVGVGVDPPGGVTECGIVAAGIGDCTCKGKSEKHVFVLADKSLAASPDVWAREVVSCYSALKADRVFGEKNYGGDMVKNIIRMVDPLISYEDVNATRGKAVRAEPIAALYEQGKVHHVGKFPELERELLTWEPGVSSWSPNRLDACVWVLTKLMLQTVVASGSPIILLQGENYWRPK